MVVAREAALRRPRRRRCRRASRTSAPAARTCCRRARCGRSRGAPSASPRWSRSTSSGCRSASTSRSRCGRRSCSTRSRSSGTCSGATAPRTGCRSSSCCWCSSSGATGLYALARAARGRRAGSSRRSCSSPCSRSRSRSAPASTSRTFGLYPTARVLTAATISPLPLELRVGHRARCSASLGVRRRALLVGERRAGRAPARDARRGAAAGSTTSSSGVARREAPACACSATSTRCRRSSLDRLDELIVADGGLSRGAAARDRRAGAPPRRPRPRRAEDDRAARRARRVRARPGRAALRAAPADPRRRRLGGQARRSTSSSAR